MATRHLLGNGLILALATASSLAFSGTAWGQTIELGPIYDPNGLNSYWRLSPATWTQSNSKAIQLFGCGLATIADDNENEFVRVNVINGGVPRGSWIGLNGPCPNFGWVCGPSVSYRHWAAGEPHCQVSCNIGPDNYVVMGGDGSWNNTLNDNAACYGGTNPGGVVKLACPDRVLTGPPGQVIVPINGTLDLQVSISGNPVSLRWRRNGVNLDNGNSGCGSFIQGVSTLHLTITNFCPGDQGPYDLVIQTSCRPTFLSPSSQVYLQGSQPGPTILAKEPSLPENVPFSNPSGIAFLRVVWSENVLFSAADITVTRSGGAAVPFTASGSGSQVMMITFDQPLFNDVYAVTILDSVVALNGSPIDGDNDGNAGGNAQLSLAHQAAQPACIGDLNNDRAVDLADLAEILGRYGLPCQ